MNRILLLIFLCYITVISIGGERFPLEKSTWNISNKDSLNGLIKVKTVPLKGTDRQVPSVTWGSPSPKMIPLNTREKVALNEFEQAEFILTLQVEKELPLRRIVIRLRDKTGETFQLAPTVKGSLKPGKNELHYVFDATDPQKCTDSIWSGNNDKKVDWPLQFSGIAIDLNAQTPDNEQIQLDALEVQYKGERCSLSLNTGHPLHLLLPDQESQPNLVVKNHGDTPAELSGTLRITDFYKAVHTEETSVTVPTNGEVKLTIPGDYTKLGWWKVDYQLKSTSGKEYMGTHRFGRMNPADPTPGRASGEYLFGMCIHPGGPFTRSPELGELEALAAGMCGAKVARTDLHWNVIQPQPDKWNFALYDRIIDAYGRNGIEIQAILAYCVKWAVQDGYKPKNPKRFKENSQFPDPHAYAKYAGAVSQHYKDRIRFYEIWNEPDIIGFANFPAENYMELLRAGYDAIKATSKDAIVLSGGIGDLNAIQGKMALLDQLIADGGKHFDIFAFHGHGTFTRYYTQLEQLRDMGLIGAKAPRPWYSNETGISSAQVDECKQGATLFEKMLCAWSEGAMAYNWYVLREKDQYPVGHHERHFGLITVDFEPKPGYLTYNMLAQLYSNGKFLRSLDFAPGIYAKLFENRTQDGLLALWADQVSKLLWIDGLPEGTTMIDLVGNEKPLPTYNGQAMLQISDVPFSLRIPNIKTQNIQSLGEVLDPNSFKQLSLSAGESQDFSVTLNNPSKFDLDFNIKVQSPSQVSAKPTSSKLKIPAGGSKAVQIKLTADREFKATPVAPEKLVLAIASAGSIAKNLEIPVISRTSKDEPMFQLDQPEQYYTFIPSAPGNEPWYWKGSEDLSAKVYMKIQAEKYSSGLSLKVEVRDDVHVQPFSGSEVWKGDNVQFALQVPSQNGYWKFGLTRLANGKPEVFCWEHPTGFTDSIEGITLKTTRNETTKITTYTAYIPLKLVGMTPDMATGGFRFNLIVNDNDDDRREGFIYIAPGLGATSEPLLWPVVNL